MLDRVFDACHDNPGDVQRLCSALWQMSTKGDEVTAACFDQAWDVLFGMQKGSYELVLVDLSPQQDRVLRALAHAGGKANLTKDFLQTTGIGLSASIRKAMTKLVEKRLVQKTGTTYSFCDPFFAAWLKRQPL